MRRVMLLMVAALLVAGAARAQTAGAAGGETEHGYVEGVAQSAFGNVTSQSYGVEAGFTVAPHVQIFGEAGQTRNVAPATLGAAAQLMAGALAQTQSNVNFTAREPVTLVAAGAKFLFGVEGSKAVPYVLAGFGLARLTRDVVFTVGGTDVTTNLQQFGITLGTDLSGASTRPMLVVGGGVTYPIWRQVGIDAQLRYGRIFAEEQGINSARVGLGIGVRF
jgi:outer membrane protein with beta-barrel domain